MPDDALVINRAADLPGLILEALERGGLSWQMEGGASRPFDEAVKSLEEHQLEALLTALGVGQPEQRVREGDLEMAAREIRWIVKFEAQHSPSRERMEDTAARIERALEGRKP